MYVIEPGISKVIRRDPILFVTFNCPVANREMIDDIIGEKFSMISFGTVKYIRMMSGGRQIVSDCTDYYKECEGNFTEKLTSLPMYTKFIPEKHIQYPISYYYIRCDVLKELDTDSHEDCLQLAYYIYETYNRSNQDKKCMTIIGEDVIHNLLNVTDEELANFNNYLVPVKEDSDGEK